MVCVTVCPSPNTVYLRTQWFVSFHFWPLKTPVRLTIRMLRPSAVQLRTTQKIKVSHVKLTFFLIVIIPSHNNFLSNIFNSIFLVSNLKNRFLENKISNVFYIVFNMNKEIGWMDINTYVYAQYGYRLKIGSWFLRHLTNLCLN